MIYLSVITLFILFLASLYYMATPESDGKEGRRCEIISTLGLLVSVISANYFAGEDIFRWASEYIYVIFFFLFIMMLIVCANSNK